MTLKGTTFFKVKEKTKQIESKRESYLRVLSCGVEVLLDFENEMML